MKLLNLKNCFQLSIRQMVFMTKLMAVAILVMGYINAGFLLIMITPIGLAFKDFSFENVMGFADAVGFFCRDTFNLSNFVRSWCLKNDREALLF